MLWFLVHSEPNNAAWQNKTGTTYASIQRASSSSHLLAEMTRQGSTPQPDGIRGLQVLRVYLAKMRI